MGISPSSDASHLREHLLGEVSHAEKIELLGGACALLNPIQWPEPFGLVMIVDTCVSGGTTRLMAS